MRLPRSIAVLGIGLCLAGVGARRARADSFPAGSLIIPTDECYQVGGAGSETRIAWSSFADLSGAAVCQIDGTATAAAPTWEACYAPAGYPATATSLQHTMGVLYLLARYGVPVQVAVRADKQALTDYDIVLPSPDGTSPPVDYLSWNGSSYVVNSAGVLTSGGSAVSYRGGPFVIDAAHAQQALNILAAAAGSIPMSDVVIHQTLTSFQASSTVLFDTSPKPIGLLSYSNAGGLARALKYIGDAGMTAALSANPAGLPSRSTGWSSVIINLNNQSPHLFHYPIFPGIPTGACTGNCGALTYNSGANRVLDAVWVPDVSPNACSDVLVYRPDQTLEPAKFPGACFDASNTCQADTCTGANYVCCPGVISGGTVNSFLKDNGDGTTTQYVCPCPAAGVSCTIASYTSDVGAGCSGCASDEYCSTTGGTTCQPKWGCQLSCTCSGSAKTTITGIDDFALLSGAASVNGVNQFLIDGGWVLASDGSPLNFEDVSNGKYSLPAGGLVAGSGALSGNNFCAAAVTTTGGALPQDPAQSPAPYPASRLSLQTAGFLYKFLGGPSPTYALASGSFRALVEGIAYQSGSAWLYTALVGYPVGLCGNPPSANCGKIIYAGANNLNASTTTAGGTRLAGLHQVYDALLASNAVRPGEAQNPLTAVELSRSSAVSATTGTYYVGTFDWKYTQPLASSGNLQWTPPLGTYPYTTGHFREYQNLAQANVTSDTAYGLSVAPQNWDAAAWIAANYGARKILYASGSGASWTLRDFGMTNINDIAAMMGLGTDTTHATSVVKKVLNWNTSTGAPQPNVLGGIDYSSAAVVEGKNNGLVSVISGATELAKTRPTVLYVGGRDGMIHAFCGEPTGSSKCTPGSELFAIIPPGQLTKMVSAYDSGDWSQINVGGTTRVADLFDNFDGGANPKVWRTVLIYGTRTTGLWGTYPNYTEYGEIGAIDISVPTPSGATYNYTAGGGLKFLWSGNGLPQVAMSCTGLTTPWGFGPTRGVGLAAPSGVSGLVVATSGIGPAHGTGLTTSVLRAWDGNLLACDQRAYTRPMPQTAAGGGTSPVPNQPPAVPTILDQDQDGSDDTVLVPTYEGKVWSYPLAPSGSLGGLGPTLLFDASASYTDTLSPNGCTVGTVLTACQPISAPISIFRRAGGNPSDPVNPVFALLVGTGGADWAAPAVTAGGTTYNFLYRIFGVSIPANPNPSPLTPAPLFTLKPGAVDVTTWSPGQVPPTIQNGSQVLLPLRDFGQPLVVGKDLYVSVTTLGVGSTQQLLQEQLYPGRVFGKALRWNLGDSPDSSYSATYNWDTSTTVGAFGGGAGSVLMTGADGGVVVVGSGKLIRHNLNNDSLQQSLTGGLAVNGATTRNFLVRAWFGGDD